MQHSPPTAAPEPDQELLASLNLGAPHRPGREEALGIFRRHLGRTQAYVAECFEHGRLAGRQAAQKLAAHTDELIAALFLFSVEECANARLTIAPHQLPGGAHELAVVATGGYGQGALAPYSDIDLLFLTQSDTAPDSLIIVEYMLYFLWDLGLKIGHATRSIEQCLVAAKEDLTIGTSLLDARFLAGARPSFDSFRHAYKEHRNAWGAYDFIARKQAERSARHTRYGDSPYLVEPNVKEGRGGLRDIQTLCWIARYLFDIQGFHDLVGLSSPAGPLLTEEEARLARRSADFLWTVRFNLHYVAGRAEDRLTFDLQPIVGARMGYTRHGRQNSVERFMRHYFLTVREVTRLTRILEPALVRIALGAPAIVPATDQKLIEAGFMLLDGKLLSVANRASNGPEGLGALRLIQFARDRDLELHPLAIRGLIRNERAGTELRHDPHAAAIFLDLLCGHPNPGKKLDSAKWVSIMNETGLLGRYLPDWARIVGQMQFDTYHIFTVDQHTIEAIRVLNQIESGELRSVAPVASGAIAHVQSRRSLYVAMLLHDIAKGRGGDHSEIGAEIATRVCPMLGFSAEETEMTSWLVLHHLLLSQTAFRRDIDDPKTILDLADVIQSPERLRLLLVLTVADMRAVSAKVWNNWKATLLRELYSRVSEVLEGGLATTERDVRVQRARAAAAALLVEWPHSARDAYLDLGYPSYWLAFDPETHARHARMIRDATERGVRLTVETQTLPARSVSEVTVYAADHAGLFSRLTGALALAGASIVDARIHTMTNGMALDTFWIQDAAGGPFDQPSRLARLYVLIERALSGSASLMKEISELSPGLIGRRMRAIHVPPRVVIDNRASNTHTVIEVNGRDRPGLLHDVTAAISDQGLQIASAHVTTYGIRAVDVFYVKDVFGLKVEHDSKLARLREALLQALQEAPK